MPEVSFRDTGHVRHPDPRRQGGRGRHGCRSLVLEIPDTFATQSRVARAGCSVTGAKLRRVVPRRTSTNRTGGCQVLAREVNCVALGPRAGARTLLLLHGAWKARASACGWVSVKVAPGGVPGGWGFGPGPGPLASRSRWPAGRGTRLLSLWRGKRDSCSRSWVGPGRGCVGEWVGSCSGGRRAWLKL